MSARERVLRTFAREKTDRVTIGYETNDAVHRRFAAALGLPPGADIHAVGDAIGVDYRKIWPEYTGPQLFKAPPGRIINPEEGCVMRWVENPSGGYWDYCDFPLIDADEEQIAAFPIPNPDDFDYETAGDMLKALNGRLATYIGGTGVPDVINSNSRIMGMEDMLCHLILENEAALAFINRRADFQLGMMERLLEKCKGYLDFVWYGEDLGTQIAPIINPVLYRKLMKPIHKKFAGLADAYGLPTLMHSCGCSSWAYEDFIEIGIKGVDSIQPEIESMSPRYLMEHFGGKLNFRGLISTGHELAFGTPDDVRRVCKETIEIMNAKGGYHFGPSQAIQDNSPAENVIAMYQAAHDAGV